MRCSVGIRGTVAVEVVERLSGFGLEEAYSVVAGNDSDQVCSQSAIIGTEDANHGRTMPSVNQHFCLRDVHLMHLSPLETCVETLLPYQR